MFLGRNRQVLPIFPHLGMVFRGAYASKRLLPRADNILKAKYLYDYVQKLVDALLII
jgi:hypothetical protein